MIVVTGGAGFIGSNIVHSLNQNGRSDILVVDNLTNGVKFNNLADLAIADYQDKLAFLAAISTNTLNPSTPIEAVFHLGACSDTTEWNGEYMMRNNYEYSKILLHYCLARKIPFIYASSAAVYGNSTNFQELPANEKPINVYGYSKLLFDQYVRRLLPQTDSQIVGLRYFNVYGPREQHKGKMASVVYHANNQVLTTGKIQLFTGCDGYGDGEQVRDFISVTDVAATNLWLWQHPHVRGIYNLGTGQAASFNALARAVLAWHGQGAIEYIPFPEILRERYQSFTQADPTSLRQTGCDLTFSDITTGVANYLNILNKLRIKKI